MRQVKLLPKSYSTATKVGKGSDIQVNSKQEQSKPNSWDMTVTIFSVQSARYVIAREPNE